MEAHPNLPAYLVMLETTTLSKEALPVVSVILEATADLGRQPAHCVMPAVTIPPKAAQLAHCVMLEPITLRKEAHSNLPAFLVMLDPYVAKKVFLNK